MPVSKLHLLFVLNHAVYYQGLVIQVHICLLDTLYHLANLFRHSMHLFVRMVKLVGVHVIELTGATI